MKFFIALLFAFSASAFAQVGSPNIVGPVVEGKLEGSVELAYMPFSKGAGAGAVIATESFAMPRGGSTLGGHFNLNGIAADRKLWLSKYTSGTGHKDAPTVLDSSSQYLLIGGREYGAGSVRGIGFGYVGSAAETAPVFVGVKEVNTDLSTTGDLIFATRATTSNTTPSVRLSVTAAGQITAADGYAPKANQDLATKAYVDSNAGGGVPFDNSFRMVDKIPEVTDQPCRKGDLFVPDYSPGSITSAYICLGKGWRVFTLDSVN